MFKLLMEEANGGDGTGGAGGAAGGTAAAPNIADGDGGAGAGGKSLGNGGGDAGGGGGNDKSWLEALPDDIKADPSLKMFKDPSSLAKSWVNAQKMMGADKVVMPTEKSTEDEWNAFYQKLGRPESPEKYEIKPPEGMQLDETLTNGFKQVAHKLGLSPKQASALAEWKFGADSEAQKMQETAKINEMRESIKTYADKLGGEDKYMARVDNARVALRALAKPELTEFLKTSGLGSRPEMIEFFAELKEMMGEDKIRDGTGVNFGGEDPSVLQKEIEEIEKKMFTDMNNPNKETWIQQRSKLYERLNASRARA